MKWVHLTTAPDQTIAATWRDLLNQEGVSAVIRASDVSSFLGVSLTPCRIMVPEEEMERAKDVLAVFLDEGSQ